MRRARGCPGRADHAAEERAGQTTGKKAKGLGWIYCVTVKPLIVLRGGGNLHRATQNLVKSASVRTITTLL